jgi:predicted ATPase
MSSAEACFQRSLAYARDQSALSWELRTATSLARLQRDRGDVSIARATIKAVYGRFTEGFSTEDLRAAKALLQTMD